MVGRSELGTCIASVRTLRRLRQSDLADMLGTSTQTVSNWETGASIPRADMLRDLCVCLSCSSNYLLGLGDEAPRSVTF